MPPPRWHSIFIQQKDEFDDTHSAEFEDSLNKQFSQAKDSLQFQRIRKRFRQPYQIERLLRQREIGHAFSHLQTKSSLYEDFHRWKSWTGASKDILSVAWGSSGLFSIGSSTDHLSSRDRPYNRPNNLLLGQVDGYTSSIQQLSEHKTSCDGLYATVSHVTFAQHEPQFFSASYDATVRVWDVSITNNIPRARCRLIFPHDKHVDIVGQRLTASPDETLLLSTAQQDRAKAISLWNAGSVDQNADNVIAGDRLVMHLASERASRYNIFPSSMQWGISNLLLAGFAESNQNDLADREGHICLWDVGETPSLIKLTSCEENVFDVFWAPGRKFFAAATTPRNSATLTHKKKTRTVVRVWSPFESSSRIREFECPALDINEVRFHPVNDNFVVASATDGRVYVWDARKEDAPIVVLQHGDPIETLDSNRAREESDVGVRFMSWDRDGRNLYTGSSDGRVGCWNIMVSPEDALVKEVASFDSGVMAGSFSHDGTKLLLGTVKGSVEILSVGAAAANETDDLDYICSLECPGGFDTMPAVNGDDQGHGAQEGIDIASHLVQSGQIEIDLVYGPGKGDRYSGPFNSEARAAGCLLPTVAAQQFSSSIRRQGRMAGGITLEASDNIRRVARNLTRERRVRLDRRQPINTDGLPKKTELDVDDADLSGAPSSVSLDSYSSPCASGEDEELYDTLVTEAVVGLQAPLAVKRKHSAIGPQLPERMKKSRDNTPVLDSSSSKLIQPENVAIDVDTYSFSPSWRSVQSDQSDQPNHTARSSENINATDAGTHIASPSHFESPGEKWRAILDGSPSKSPKMNKRSPGKKHSDIAKESGPSTPSKINNRTIDSIFSPASLGRGGFIMPSRRNISDLHDKLNRPDENESKDTHLN